MTRLDFASMADTDIVWHAFCAKPDRTYFSSAEEFRQALERYTNVTAHFIDYAVNHESQHVSAAMAVGAEALYSILEAEDGTPRIFTAIGDCQIPKLAAIAITAAPFDPSEDDLTEIHDYGYTGVDDVAERVIDWNRQEHGLFIPVPMSYSPLSPTL